MTKAAVLLLIAASNRAGSCFSSAVSAPPIRLEHCNLSWRSPSIAEANGVVFAKVCRVTRIYAVHIAATVDWARIPVAMPMSKGIGMGALRDSMPSVIVRFPGAVLALSIRTDGSGKKCDY
jgi:hypothetical protein